jgi:hypothetical protein
MKLVEKSLTNELPTPDSTSQLTPSKHSSRKVGPNEKPYPQNVRPNVEKLNHCCCFCYRSPLVKTCLRKKKKEKSSIKLPKK